MDIIEFSLILPIFGSILFNKSSKQIFSFVEHSFLNHRLFHVANFYCSLFPFNVDMPKVKSCLVFLLFYQVVLRVIILITNYQCAFFFFRHLKSAPTFQIWILIQFINDLFHRSCTSDCRHHLRKTIIYYVSYCKMYQQIIGLVSKCCFRILVLLTAHFLTNKYFLSVRWLSKCQLLTDVQYKWQFFLYSRKFDNKILETTILALKFQLHSTFDISYKLS